MSSRIGVRCVRECAGPDCGKCAADPVVFHVLVCGDMMEMIKSDDLPIPSAQFKMSWTLEERLGSDDARFSAGLCEVLGARQ